ncbi:hypothetical protein MARPU_05890 [Marichromatium purpuratum 984]|uniref:Uncharacterized protein n=1 Tax=Marichromatium purpuratum 984 TaxID=765910 RepID=W0E3J3_MARPU|nr:efflux RND transporter periplasmic adaptor subunit [Marichromatium purpuratum]AHF05425.1 hypothetical protein MARPU_05890 [Marichromatium purpuratum 984]
MHGRARPSPITLLLVSALSTILVGCSPEATDPSTPLEPRIAQVRVLTLEPRPWRQPIDAYGEIEAVEDVAFTVDFSAQVEAIHFDEGQRVEAGALLVELDARKRGLRLRQATTAVARTRAGLEEAHQELDRRRGLAGSGAVSREALERAEIALRRASAAYEEMLAAERLAAREVAESRVLSPVDGIIDRRAVEPGEMVMPGQLLGSVQTADRLRVRAHVGERAVNALRVGAEAEIRSAGVPGRRYRGRIESVGIKADPDTGNFPIKILLDDTDGLLRPGMTARVRLQAVLDPEALLIPDTALVDRHRRRVVYVVRDGRAVEIEPMLRASTAEWIPALEGLAAGDRLVVEGMAQLIDASPVEIVTEPTP